MTDDTQVWFITGAGRGMGVDLAKAALEAGHNVVATARDAAKVTEALGEHANLLAASLDVTNPDTIRAAVDSAISRFGRIDVLVNNAGNFYAGFFEEISDAQMRKQMETNFFGPLNVTRQILPVMRKQRSGKIVSFSSAAGIIGQEFCAAYAASKFAIEGWMESLRFDVAPYGISTTIVEPGFFRTELLTEGSSLWPELSIDDYAERTTETIAAWKSMNGQQAGSPRSSARRWWKSSPSTNRRCAGSPAVTLLPASSRRPATSSPRPTHTGTFPRTSTTTPEPLPPAGPTSRPGCPSTTPTEGTTMKRTLATMTAVAALVALTACSSMDSDVGAATSSNSGSSSASSSASSSTGAESDGTTAITITAGGQTFDATLNNNDVSEDFVKTLPRTLDFNRNAGIEFISEFPKPMTETGPFYTDVQPGDLVYYNPADSITVIYEETSSVPTLTKMGKVTSNLDAFENLPDEVSMRFELK